MSKPKPARDNRANQLNPIHPAYHRSRGADPSEAKRMTVERSDSRAVTPIAEPAATKTPKAPS